MKELPLITEADIRDWTDPRSFGRGQRYYCNGHITHPQRQGDTLKARCIGSRPQPYRVEITLGRRGVAHGACSCPVGAGGHCKHAVALLLTWLHEPDTFTAVEDLETALGRRSKDELIVVIRRMLDRCPELETVLELPVVGEAEGAPPVDGALIRRQARGAFAGIGYDDWGDAYDVAQQLLTLVQIGDDYAEIKRWSDAATVYQIVMEEALENYGMLYDESGSLHKVVDGCVDGLGACLATTEDPSRRERLLEALFGVYRWDIELGGVEVGYRARAVIIEQATAEEKWRVAQWVRDAMPGDSTWGREACGRFLLQLEEAWLDDEAFLRICRETGRREDLVERLLALDRLEEAVDAVREVRDYELLRLADVFIARGHADTVDALVRERLGAGRDAHLMAWLKERALERGDQEKALALAEALFWRHPTLQGYQELQALAQPMGRWDGLRAAILTRLIEEEKRALLIEIHLAEGAVDRALETLEGMEATGRRHRRSDQLTMQIARAAEEERPREAIRLYVEAVEQLIAQRGRHNYATAASYLTRVRELYRRLDEMSTWEATIAELQEANRRLRALKDELRKAGLIG